MTYLWNHSGERKPADYHLDRAIGRRDVELEDPDSVAIRMAIARTWSDYMPIFIEAYSVTPQPEKLAQQGWSMTVQLRTPQIRAAPGIIVLRETILFRQNPNFLVDFEEFEAGRFPSPAWNNEIIETAGLQMRCDPRRHGHCSILRSNQPLVPNYQHVLRQGDHLIFLVDDAHPPPLEAIIFEDHFFEDLETILQGRTPMQFAAVAMHGHADAPLGARIVSLRQLHCRTDLVWQMR